ncbi:MAG: hypothetical protein SVP52_09695 [Chloroflexota bacterium]|nr:hypothetical protein [Chloroflexota bacterium]
MSNEVVNDFQHQQAPEKKNKTTLWIILGIALAVMLCCCALAAIGLVFGVSMVYDGIDFSFAPLLNLIK